MRKLIKLLLMPLSLMIVVGGCYRYPEADIYLTDLDIVVTHYRESVDFSEFSSYILVDSVVIFDDEGEVDSDDPFYINGYDQVILDEIRTQLGNLGYVSEEDPRRADVGVVATALRVLNEGIIYSPGWWYGYPGYGWWYGGWYGSPYPGYGYGGWYGSYYSYEKGSIVIDMVDLNPSDPDSTLIWTGLVNGLTSDNNSLTVERITNSIESAFLQSRNFYPRGE